MLEMGIKPPRTKLKEDIRIENFQLVTVRQDACKELLNSFNAINEENFSNNIPATARSEAIGKLTETIQERLIQKDNLQFQE